MFITATCLFPGIRPTIRRSASDECLKKAAEKLVNDKLTEQTISATEKALCNKTVSVHKSRSGIPSQWYNHGAELERKKQNGHVQNGSVNSCRSATTTTNSNTQTNHSTSLTKTSPKTSPTSVIQTQTLSEELNTLIQCTEEEQRKTLGATPDLLQSSYAVQHSSDLGTPV